MQYRQLGRTGWSVSEVSFGAWAIGGSWGPVDDVTSARALEEAVDRGVNLIDTADVYGDGRSERLVGGLLRRRSEKIYVATKAGRRLSPHVAEGYTLEALRAFSDRSRSNLGVDTMDLLQLHCPPSAVYGDARVFDALETLVHEQRIRAYGVSVETIDEALAAIERYPNVQTVQIIFNMFRRRPAERLLGEAERRRVGVLARVPLASGLLTGKLTATTSFADDDHRAFNRHGEAFDMGETFSGVDYATALQAVEELRPLTPKGLTMTQFALRWILMHAGITCTIPGARTPAQVADNCAASDAPPIDPAGMRAVGDIYDRHIRPLVHARW